MSDYWHINELLGMILTLESWLVVMHLLKYFGSHVGDLEHPRRRRKDSFENDKGH